MTAFAARYKKIASVTALTAAIALVAFLSLRAYAQETAETTPGDLGIQISSPIYNFDIDPGSTAQEIIKIRNISSSAKTFYPEVLDFKPTGETGAPTFLKADESASYTYSLSSWIKISKEGLTLKPNESAALNFTVTVPQTAEAGGHYAGILFGTTAPATTGSGAAISNKVGSLVLVRVAGKADEAATVKEFTTPKNSYETGPIDFVVRIENSGNIHIISKGNIEIKDTFGKSVAILPVNSKNGNVLPESIRRFDNKTDSLSWNPKGFTFGRYKAELLLTYGSPAQTLSSTLSFWIVPWKQLLLIGLAIIIIILLLVLIVKRYNHYIVAKALNQNPPGSVKPPVQ